MLPRIATMFLRKILSKKAVKRQSSKVSSQIGHVSANGKSGKINERPLRKASSSAVLLQSPCARPSLDGAEDFHSFLNNEYPSVTSDVIAFESPKYFKTGKTDSAETAPSSDKQSCSRLQKEQVEDSLIF